MYSRDKIFLLLGTAIAGIGAIATILWTYAAGIIALLAIAVVIILMLVLQRRQLAKIQERTLKLVKAQQSARSQQSNSKAPARKEESLAVSTKKIIGILQAQQISVELLHAKIDRVAESDE